MTTKLKVTEFQLGGLFFALVAKNVEGDWAEDSALDMDDAHKRGDRARRREYEAVFERSVAGVDYWETMEYFLRHPEQAHLHDGGSELTAWYGEHAYRLVHLVKAVLILSDEGPRAYSDGLHDVMLAADQNQGHWFSPNAFEAFIHAWYAQGLRDEIRVYEGRGARTRGSSGGSTRPMSSREVKVFAKQLATKLPMNLRSMYGYKPRAHSRLAEAAEAVLNLNDFSEMKLLADDFREIAIERWRYPVGGPHGGWSFTLVDAVEDYPKTDLPRWRKILTQMGGPYPGTKK